eukprot:scaffold548445_cov39-Prasinocladus_malaysianus.AAC.1
MESVLEGTWADYQVFLEGNNKPQENNEGAAQMYERTEQVQCLAHIKQYRTIVTLGPSIRLTKSVAALRPGVQ